MNFVIISSVLFNLLLTCNLIIGHHHLQGRIANGKDAEPHIAPYLVSIQVKYLDNYVHSCGGMIINENWILTAAHCLYDKSIIPSMLIRAGRHNIQLDHENLQYPDPEQQRQINWYQIHENYTEGNLEASDIALLYTEMPFVWSKTVQPIALPIKINQKYSGIATLYGWGLLDNNRDHVASILQTIDLTILSYEECQSKELSVASLIKSSNICTLDKNGGGGSACSSDSGGPLVKWNIELERLEVIGIVSWGPPCGQPNKSVTIYVGVSSFIDWIAKVQQKHVLSQSK